MKGGGRTVMPPQDFPKRGELPWAKVEAWRKELNRDIERALAETNLPEHLTTKRQIAFS